MRIYMYMYMNVNVFPELAISCPLPQIQWNLSNTDTLGPIKYVLIRKVSSFQGTNNIHSYEVGTWSSVLCPDLGRCPYFL